MSTIHPPALWGYGAAGSSRLRMAHNSIAAKRATVGVAISFHDFNKVEAFYKTAIIKICFKNTCNFK
jgi:hypothetical protein